jgi:hypothetical protein
MGLCEDGEAGKLSPGDLQLGQATGPICSLNEAQLQALDRCVLDSPLTPVILPLMWRVAFLAKRCTRFNSRVCG